MGERSAEVDAKIESYHDAHQPMAARLRGLIHTELDDVEEAVKWGNPCFLRGGDKLFYLSDARDHVKFGLFEGAGLSDPAGIVEGTGKSMRHVKVRELDDETRAAIADLIQEAAR